jgi:hypothetical protein
VAASLRYAIALRENDDQLKRLRGAQPPGTAAARLRLPVDRSSLALAPSGWLPISRRMLRSHHHSAGRSADAYYRQALREWRDLPALRWTRRGLLALLAVGYVAEVLWVHHLAAWLLGVGVAMCACAYTALSNFAPAHIENWKTGADAERRTEKTLRALEREGWHAVHDLPTAFGNIDHVVIGPGGVFALDTKEPQGRVSVDGEIVRVSRRANPRGTYTDAKMATAARGAAWGLSREIADILGRAPWVHAAIVLWSPFEQRVLEGKQVAFVHGDELTQWLRKQPARLRPQQIAAITAVIRTRTELDAA